MIQGGDPYKHLVTWLSVGLEPAAEDNLSMGMCVTLA